MVKANFVAVTIRAGEKNRSDAIGDFIRQCGLKLTGTGQNLIVISPSGKQLGGTNGEWSDIPKALAEWKNLPAKERKPGSIKIGELGEIDKTYSPPTPPPGGLILKQYFRSLAWASKEKLRYVKREDFIQNLGKRATVGEVAISNPAFYEAQPDFVWFTEEEWKSLIPTKFKKGEEFPVSQVVVDRLLLFHTEPTMAFGEQNGWTMPRPVRSSEMKFIVENATEDILRLRLEGYALLGTTFEKAQKAAEQWHIGYGYEPHFVGFVEYNRKNKKITRFDLIGLGDTYGIVHGGHDFYRPSRRPLGIAFELGDPNVPADCVEPRPARGAMLYKRYFNNAR